MSTRRRGPARARTGAPPPRRARTIQWTDRAQNDLIEIGDFIGKDNPDAAAHRVGMLIEAVEPACAFPLSGRVVPELDRDEIRELIRHSYRTVYRVTDETIDVLTVLEGHRRLRAGVDQADV
ncbi:MAG: type II toxin-antitoxin system RelE/ParE family toxin [Acidobacteria bacterium]|nr:type II toxin-antitoxin system RelE/ParE family toxin [Acidobacteriota bacterium]